MFSKRYFSEWCVQRVVWIRKGKRHQNASKQCCFQAFFAPLKAITPVAGGCQQSEKHCLENTVWNPLFCLSDQSALMHVSKPVLILKHATKNVNRVKLYEQRNGLNILRFKWFRSISNSRSQKFGKELARIVEAFQKRYLKRTRDGRSLLELSEVQSETARR